MKPRDAFLGVIDFFATLVPGAVAVFLLLNENQKLIPPPSGWTITLGSAVGWAVFFVAAFLLGHAIAAVGSWLDHLYDRVYARWKRTNGALVEPRLPFDATWWMVFKTRAGQIWQQTNPDDALLAAAKMLQKRQLQNLTQGTAYRPDDITDTFSWASTIVRLKSPAGTTEVEGLQAQSKLFRSMIIILLLLLPWWPFPRASYVAVWFSLLALSLWRFCKLRWDSTKMTYEYFLALAILGGRSVRDRQPGTVLFGRSASQERSLREESLSAEEEPEGGPRESVLGAEEEPESGPREGSERDVPPI